MRSFAVLCLSIGLAAAQTSPSTDTNSSIFEAQSYHSSNIITIDVAVIGGGSSGTYGAIKLKDMGRSVVVVEQHDVLGGHENTYIDPTTQTPIDYGTQAYWNISVVTDFFARYDIPIETFGFSGGSNIYADFTTGKALAGFAPSTNFTPYANQLYKYPYLLNSWTLPYPVPSDLLLPFSEFISKYSLQNIAYSIYSNSLGIGNILQQLTVNVFKIFDAAYLDGLKGGDVATTNHDNGELYVKALAELGSSALMSSTVIAAQRPSDKESVKLVVRTPTGNKLIVAKKLLISIPPLVTTLAPFDLDSEETNLFKEWTYSGYYNGLVQNTGLAAGTRYVNAAAQNLYNIPTLPAVYEIVPTRVAGIYYYWYGSQGTQPQATIQAEVAATIGKLTNSTSTSGLEFVAFSSHTPFKLVVSANDISSGFYKGLEGLQGHKNTYWTGAAFLSHSSGELWNYTQALLPGIVSAT
ncbi:hypothetical protein MMC15_003946 [Xylographa vitiligo]|nr:hypothetical protein [Xylographa vitiligo]